MSYHVYLILVTYVRVLNDFPSGTQPTRIVCVSVYVFINISTFFFWNPPLPMWIREPPFMHRYLYMNRNLSSYTYIIYTCLKLPVSTDLSNFLFLCKFLFSSNQQHVVEIPLSRIFIYLKILIPLFYLSYHIYTDKK